jgi:hypothetical protein
MRVLQYLLVFFIHFFVLIMMVYFPAILLKDLVSNSLVVEVLFWTMIVVVVWLSHHISKRIVFENLSWLASITQVFKDFSWI